MAQPAHPFPSISLPHLSGETSAIGTPVAPAEWRVVVVYRGLHCPLCKKYLAQLQELVPSFAEIGVDVVAVSGDGAEKARKMAEEVGLTLPVAYDLSVEQMHALSLHISDPRSPQETDQPFPEPGVFVINGEGTIQIMDVSNAPFSRPDLQSLVGGVKFIRENDYPIRGTHAA